MMAEIPNQKKEAYDEHFVLDNKLILDWYPQRVVAQSSGPSMLELGLGHGFSTSFFARHFKPYKVIDGSAEMIARFRSRFDFPQVDIVESWFEHFDTDDRYDNIAMGFILEHVDDPGLILRKYCRLLNPGGSVFVAVPNSESLHRRFGQAAGLLSDLEQLSDVDLEFGHQRYFNRSSLAKLCEDSGYKVVKTEGLFLKPITTGQIEQLELDSNILQAMLKVGVDFPELCNAILMKLQPQEIT